MEGQGKDSTSEVGACEHGCFAKASDGHLSYGPRSPNTDTLRHPEVSAVSAKSLLVCVCNAQFNCTCLMRLKCFSVASIVAKVNLGNLEMRLESINPIRIN